jgi:hypothetical protein
MNEQLITRLKELARRKCFHDEDDAVVEDYAGGNVDDAFDLGERAGETMLARDVLTALNIEWGQD